MNHQCSLDEGSLSKDLLIRHIDRAGGREAHCTRKLPDEIVIEKTVDSSVLLIEGDRQRHRVSGFVGNSL